MIIKLDNSDEKVANSIYSVFQNSYKVEAQLIGVHDFPPLFRSALHIQNSKTLFYGFTANECLAAVIEIDIQSKRLDINSLTVDPRFFRKGIADKLISHIFTTFKFDQAYVETAVVNEPAIRLYKKHGFVEIKRWTPDHGIQKIAMLTANES